MKNKGLLFNILLLTGILYLTITVYLNETKKRQIKEDLIELSMIKYGLFNVDEWKEILSEIIVNKIENFNLEGSNRETMRVEISGFLHEQMNEFEKRYHEEKSQTISGVFQSGIATITGTFKELKKEIPTFTEEILNFMSTPQNKKALQKFIIDKLDEYADNTFSEVDYSRHDEIILRYGFQDKEQTLKELKAKVEALNEKNLPYQTGLVVLAVLTALIILFSKSISKADYHILTAISFTFLLSGLLLPMIEIDARVSQMNFILLGEPITFQDQVLYYKSKSILEVISLMMTQNKVDLIFVGFLVLTFSVLFPVTKLISSVLYLESPKLESNKFIQFMIFKTGKWSMADVLVIAIFMAYIGFSGIVTEQLSQIESIAKNVDIFTTNESCLMSGFYTFTAFVFLSLLISHKLQYEYR